MRLSLAVLASLAGMSAAVAQQTGHHAPATPYAGLEKRAVKALSDEQIADLRAGRGMGLALPAELTAIPARSICWNWATGSAHR